MSTKCTLKYGDDYHFYEECFDMEHVYLEIDGADFSACKDGVMVEIPRRIWNEIVKVGILNVMTPEEVRKSMIETMEEFEKK